MASYLINTKKDLIEAVKEITGHKRLSHDTETKGPVGQPDISGLYPFHGSRSFSHIVATEKDEYYFNFNTGGINPKFKELLQPIFDDKERLIFYVNAIFDATISHFDGLEFKQRIADCPSLARVEFNRHTGNKGSKWAEETYLSLGYLANYYKVKQKDDRVKQYIEANNLYGPEKCRFTGKEIPLYDKVPLDLMFEYGCGDGRSTFDLGNNIVKCINYKDGIYQTQRADAGKMIDVAKNEIELTSVLVGMKIDGLKVWKDYVEKAIIHEQKTHDEIKKEVDKLTGGINFNSSKQIAEYLKAQGVEVPKKEPTDNDIKQIDKWLLKRENFIKEFNQIKGLDNLNGRQLKRLDTLRKKIKEAEDKIEGYKAGRDVTDKKVLKKVMEERPDLDVLAKMSKAKVADKKVNTYYKNFLLLKDINDIIHCGLNQEKAITGRFSSSEPNLQNLHKESWPILNDKDEIIGYNEYLVRKAFIADPGCRLFFADYSQQEMIVMLDQAGEMSVIDKLLSGEFEDFYLATMAVLYEITGRVITRQQAKAIALGLAYGQGIKLLAKNLGMTVEEAKAFKAAFFQALPKLKRFAKKLERDVQFYGKIHNPFGRVSYIDSNDGYKALNSFVQGTSADITKRAMIACHKALAPYKTSLRLCVHDELIFNVVIGEEKFVLPLIKEAMENAYPHKHIKLKADFEFAEINEHGVSAWGEKQPFNLELVA